MGQTIEPDSIDSIVCDPPYGISLNLNGLEEWDAYNAKDYEKWCELWGRAALRVAKPGAHLVAFSATRTHHRLMSGLEDAGWEIRDMGVWLYKSGFPKSGDISWRIDEHFGAEREVIGHRKMADTSKVRPGFTGITSKDGRTPMREVPITASATPEAKRWEGHSVALKPAIEPWVLARKPCEGTVVENLLKYGTGVLNIEGCRARVDLDEFGRWPANAVTLEDDDELAIFRALGNQTLPYSKAPTKERPYNNGDEGLHITVKPLALMRHLVRLVTPRGGIALDPFAGTGTTLEAAVGEGCTAVGIERDKRYWKLIDRRMNKPIEATLGV